MRVEVVEYHPELITDPAIIGSVCVNPRACQELRKEMAMYGSDKEGEYRSYHRKADS